MNKPLLIIGAGGHASVLVDILRQQKREILGIVSPEMDVTRKVFQGIQHYSSDDDILNFESESIMLVNGIGSLPKSNLRSKIYDKFVALGFKFSQVVASDAKISDFAELSDGVQVMQGVIIQAGTIVGANTIVNTGAIIDHDCNIGMFNHIAPGVTLSGQVQTEKGVHIGTGASVIQSVSIGKNSVIGAGSTIAKDVAENVVCFPALITKKVIK